MKNPEYEVAHVGAVCGKIDKDATLNLTFTESSSSYSITSANGNAGGLVGEMEDDSTLHIKSNVPTASGKSVVSALGYAGGLVGKMTSEAVISFDAGLTSTYSVRGSVTGGTVAGGLYGYYENKKPNQTFNVNEYDVNATVSGESCGGLFGEFVNDNSDLTNDTLLQTVTFTQTAAPTFSSTGHSGHIGGLIGKYTAADLQNSLKFNSLSYSVSANASCDSYGGAIGKIDNAAYVEVGDLTITATGVDKGQSFGGVVGETADGDIGDFINLVGNFTLTANGFKGGGIVGHFNSDVLRLTGTTDMSAAKTADASRSGSYGQLVGYNNNVLVYTPGSWTFNRSTAPSKADDLGTWGEVVRLSEIEGTDGSTILTYDPASTAHTVTLAAAAAASSVYEIGTQSDFVTIALNIMLNQGSDYDCLKFAAANATPRSTLLAASYKLTASNLSLTGTGVNGLMRDGAPGVTAADVDDGNATVGVFTGTFDGDGKTITLTTGEAYGKRNGEGVDQSNEGSGQIYRHQYNGLFAVVGDNTDTTTIKDLTIAGNMYIRNAIGNGMSAGGAAARSHGNTTLNGITVNHTVDYYDSLASTDAADGLGKQIGGLIGFADNNSDNGKIEIKGTTVLDPTFNFSGNLKKFMMCGGAIGSVLSSKIEVDISNADADTCTVTMTASTANNISADSDYVGIGGLIGYIHSNGTYSDKTVNIKHTYIGTTGASAKACTLVNPSTNSAGRIMGYSWLNTTVNIGTASGATGLTVNNCSMTNSAANVGIMAYSATGVWNVDKVELVKLTSTGASSSLGILVNKAYDGDDGLYLNVLNSGYVFPNEDNLSNISIAASGIYDELAAYTANTAADSQKVLKGGDGCGVVSINMNTARTGTNIKVTDTGTYQNKLTSKDYSKYPNPNTRYYYNLDKMNKANSGGENLLLWSVKQYAAPNIADEFSTSLTTTLQDISSTKTCDMSGLFFYPLYNSGSCTIGDLTLTLDYDGIYKEENHSTRNTDSYKRDPGELNQHYLMHSGLFMYTNITETTTTTYKKESLTVSGDLTLKGNFLQVPDTSGDTANAAAGYCGVLYSRTMTGDLTVGTNGSITFDGLFAKTTGNTLYSDGALLVNNVTRTTNPSCTGTEFNISLTINNVSTTSAYTTNSVTLPAASSLFGKAEGNDFKITFSHIKLDSRTADLSDSAANAALNTAYGTSRSIFKDATFFESIHTNQDSQLVYDYTWAEDWEDADDDGKIDRFVTYGKEVVSSSEYENKEKRYSGTKRYFVNPIDGSDTAFSFAAGFLPYVKENYVYDPDTNDRYYREIKVNVIAE